MKAGIPVAPQTILCLHRSADLTRRQEAYPAVLQAAPLIRLQADIPPAHQKVGAPRRALRKAAVGAKVFRNRLGRRLEHRIRWEAPLAPASVRFSPAAYLTVREKAGERARLSEPVRTGRTVRAQTGPAARTAANLSAVRNLSAPRSLKVLEPVSRNPSALPKAPATDRCRPIPLLAVLPTHPDIVGEPPLERLREAVRRRASVIPSDSLLVRAA